MKLKYILVTVPFLLFMSCGDDFFDSELLTEKTEGNFYRTPDDAALALVGCYDGLQQVWNGGIAFPLAAEVLSDNCYGGTGASDGFSYQMIDEFDKDRSPSDLNVFEANWKGYYVTIFRCNKLLQSLDKVEWGNDASLRNQIESEARFIRAFSYFDMVRFFGNIPLLEEPSLDNLPQADPDDVYALITTDLLFGINNMSGDAYSESDASTNDGRVTKWAAEALLARVYLYYTGYYGASSLVSQSGTVTGSEVLGYLEDVISNSGHGLVDNFAHLWPAASVQSYAGEGNQESIFSIKYTYTSDYNGNADGNHWMVMYGMRQTDAYPYGRGWGGATVSEALYNAYDANDHRQEASIVAIEEEAIEIDIATQREYTGYYVKKYSPMSTADGQSLAESLGAVNFQIGQFQDFVAIRYADVLLMAAELGSPNAQAYFDMVRERAFKDDFTSVALTPELLMQERKLEFAFEGVRYWDLLRSGLDVAAAAINESGTTVLSAGAPVTKDVTFNASTKGLQQIPYNQINLSSGTLQQNAGW